MNIFIESLRLENGEIHNLALHQRRLSLTLLAHFGFSVQINLERELSRRSLPAQGLYKIRVTYSRQIEAIDIEPYKRRPVQRVMLVEAQGLDYRYKYADRSALEKLRQQLPVEVQPLLVQNGLLTDAVYANLCFQESDGSWVTPQWPLLQGVARAAALVKGQIILDNIRAEDVLVGRYRKVKLINCMNLFDEALPVILDF